MKAPGCLLICLLALGGPRIASGLEKVADLPTGVWSMGFAKLGEEGSSLVLGGMDGRIYRLRDARPRPIADVGGPPLRVLGADLSGDGIDEILVAAADYPSHVYAMSADGEV
ncbi:MAG: hypothetical protein GY953_18100, partial [bacterium]|nr:hypothetical protein [bacterium]